MTSVTGKPTSEGKFHLLATFHQLFQQYVCQSPKDKENCFRQLIALRNLPQVANYLKTLCFTTVKITITERKK